MHLRVIEAGNLTLFDEGRLLISNIMTDADIKEGDRIVTSNISSKFLPGILIGYATDITTDETRLTKSGYLIPVAGFDSLQEVLVITSLKEDLVQETEPAAEPEEASAAETADGSAAETESAAETGEE